MDTGGGQVRGFRNGGEVTERVGNLRNRLTPHVEDAEVGIRGSSVTGESSKGGGFRSEGQAGDGPSDVDFFFTSQKLEALARKQSGRPFKNGVLTEDALAALDAPGIQEALSAFSKATLKQLGRKGDVRLLEQSLVESLTPEERLLFKRGGKPDAKP